jgi:hypothetical protein
VQLSVDFNTTKFTRDLQRWQKTEVPLAIAKALTFTAKKGIQPELIREMSRVFDRPTRFTLNSTYVKPATVQTMTAWVGVKDYASKAIPAIKWLAPQIFGGSRGLKRSEMLLRSQGILYPDEHIVPGEKARLDAHGNMSRGQMQQILSRVGASFDGLTRARGRVSRVKGTGYSETYFYVRTPMGRLSRRGIYRRVLFASGSAVEPVLIFVKRPRYRRRYNFFRIAEQTFQLRYPLQLKYELERAIRAKAATHLI